MEKKQKFHRFFRDSQKARRVTVAAFYLLAILVANLSFPQPAKADSIVFKEATSASGSGSSISVNKPTGVATGDVLIAFISVTSSGTSTITPPAGWTTIIHVANTTPITVGSFYRVVDGTEGSSFSFSHNGGSSQRLAAGITSYRGVDVSPSTDAINVTGAEGTGTSTTTATAPAPGSTTTVGHTKIVALYATYNATTAASFTPQSSLKERIDVSTSFGSSFNTAVNMADEDQVSAGTPGAKDSTVSLSGDYRAHQIALKPDGTQHMMLFWDGTGSAPSGWSYVTEAEGRFVRGESVANYGSTGGSASHTPTVSGSVTTSAASGTQLNSGSDNPFVATSGHTHPAASVTIGSADNNPAHRTLRLIRYDSGIPNEIPAGGIAIFDGSPGIPATGWTSLSGASEVFNNRFVKIATTPNTNGGSDTHTHALDWSDLGASSGSDRVTNFLANTATSTNGHTHGDPNDTTTATNGTSAADCDAAPVDVNPTGGACLPKHAQILLAKANSNTSVLSIGLTAMFDGAPGGGWVVRSESGGDYYQSFLRGSSSYAINQGADTHTHATATAVTDPNTGTSNQTLNVFGSQLAPDGHTHTLTANFNAADNNPLYYNVVVAEKVNFILNHYGWYDDNGSLTLTNPGDRYSSQDLAQDSHIVTMPTQNSPPGIGKELRLRIQVLVNNSNLANDEMQFKLQYREDSSTSLTSTSCIDGSWTDVGNKTDSTIWRYAGDSGNPTSGDQITGTSVMSPTSTGLHRYVRSTTAGKNIGAVNSGQTMEWDYHIVNNGAKSATQYRFRLVEDSGINFSQYGYTNVDTSVTPLCPTLTTKPGPADQLRHGNFFDFSGQEKGFSWVE